MLADTVLGVSPQRPRGSIALVERAFKPLVGPLPDRARARVWSALLATVLLLGVGVSTVGCRSDAEATAPPPVTPSASVGSAQSSSPAATQAPTTVAVPTTAAGPAPDGSDLHPLVVTPGEWTDAELAIINGFVDAEVAAAVADSKPDERDPALAATHVDPMLAQRRKVFEAHRIQGRASRLPTNGLFSIWPERIEMVDATTARLWVCESSDGPLYEKATGTIIDGRVTTVRDLAALVLVDKTWKLSERVNKGEWEGAERCPDE